MDTDAFDLDWDYGGATHHYDGSLTEYGKHWLYECWPKIVAETVAMTRKVSNA